MRSRFNESGNEKNFDCDMEEVSSDEKDNTTDTTMAEEMQEENANMGGIPVIRLPSALLKKIREP
ncbi:hypothetical protein ACSBR2_033776 [Camellia fascicularis]